MSWTSRARDSFRFREAGADQVLLASRKRVAIMQECATQREPVPEDVLRFIDRSCADLVLVEGFGHAAIPGRLRYTGPVSASRCCIRRMRISLRWRLTMPSAGGAGWAA
ncbi:MAG: molybdopterin-guanine dinucleotide biosynthesis protein MobB [Thiolinea sp.]